MSLSLARIGEEDIVIKKSEGGKEVIVAMGLGLDHKSLIVHSKRDSKVILQDGREYHPLHGLIFYAMHFHSTYFDAVYTSFSLQNYISRRIDFLLR